MRTPLHAAHQRKSPLGTLLVTLGSVAVVADLQVLAQPLARLAETLHDGIFGLLPALGLSFLNTARALLLDQVDYFSLISRILILFTAALAIIIGLVLLRSHSDYLTGEDCMPASTLRGREPHNG